MPKQRPIFTSTLTVLPYFPPSDRLARSMFTSEATLRVNDDQSLLMKAESSSFSTHCSACYQADFNDSTSARRYLCSYAIYVVITLTAIFCV